MAHNKHDVRPLIAADAKFVMRKVFLLTAFQSFKMPAEIVLILNSIFVLLNGSKLSGLLEKYGSLFLPHRNKNFHRLLAL